MTQPAVEATERPRRVCDVCYGFDTAPRHVIAHPQGAVPVAPDAVQRLAQNVDFTTSEGAAALTDLMDTSVQLRHLDCCAETGCPDGTCTLVRQGAEDLKDDELVAHLTQRNPDETETVFVNGHPNSAVVKALSDDDQNTES